MSSDTAYDRKNANSLKYDCTAHCGKPEGLLPLWVADMDFPAPKCVNEALEEHCRHGICEHSEPNERYFQALQNQFSTCHGQNVEDGWLIKTSGIMFTLCAAIRSLTQPGDAMLIQAPVYYPLTESILANNRRLVRNSLVYQDGGYSTDFEDFERKIESEKIELFLLCNPHNPVGRVWTEQELVWMSEICLQHGVTVISDEIYADFAYPGHQHLVFASLRPQFEQITITCIAPTKTFNLAGSQISNILISDQSLRRAFRAELGHAGYNQADVVGLITCRAAYEGGTQWLNDLKGYLVGSLDFVREYLHEHIPSIYLIEPQGTCPTWLDCAALGLGDDALNRLTIERAGLWLDSGSMFGKKGKGFRRTNIACLRAVLRQALERLAYTVAEL